jgi:outer membrane protein assembly factor BamA
VAEQITADAQAIETPSPRRNSRPVVINSVDVEGNIRLADLAIIAMGGLDQGSAYTIFDIQRATKTMWATGQFNDIRVRAEGDVGDRSVTLIWEVDEKERADAISR